ncbi:MAG: hypothetical protein NTU63_02550 [Candidatus Pacearchaeota archaeon]|nr:hypothetical protein [Candidatus Pacearchaeota archaeon]
MKKRDLIHSFVILLILVVAIGSLFLFTKFTGYAIAGQSCNDNNTIDGDGCSAAGLVETGWVCDGEPIVCTEVVTPVCDTTHLTLCLDEPTCTVATGYWYDSLCNAEPASVCDTTHLTLCLDEPTCTAATGYWYNGVCNAEEQCVPECSGKECSDDGCGGNCGDCDEGYTCSSGTCEAEEEQKDTEEIHTTVVTPATGEVVASETTTVEVTPLCTPNWQCDEVWSECVSGQQTRACIDSNACGTEEGSPPRTQDCVVEETCGDGIKNQNEEDIDCGGVCEKCKKNIFTIIGSAVNGPINSGKTFFQKEILGNKTRAFIILGFLIAGVAGFVLVRKFLKINISLKK